MVTGFNTEGTETGAQRARREEHSSQGWPRKFNIKTQVRKRTWGTRQIEKPDGVAMRGEFNLRYVRREDVSSILARVTESGIQTKF